MKILQKIVYVLHLHVSWVRVMLTFSVLAVLVIFTFPEKQKEQVIYKPQIEMLTKHQAIKSDSTILFSKSLDIDTPKRLESISGTAPIEVKIISDKKFDWKGTSAWGIGLVNGVILLIMNLKKLFLKKAE